MTVIERKEFEEAADSFFKRVILPVEEVMNKAGVTID